MFIDDYEIEDQFQALRKKLTAIEEDLYKFIGPAKNDSAAVRVRNGLRDIRDSASKLYHDIAKQRQDNKSSYD